MEVFWYGENYEDASPVVFAPSALKATTVDAASNIMLTPQSTTVLLYFTRQCLYCT